MLSPSIPIRKNEFQISFSPAAVDAYFFDWDVLILKHVLDAHSLMRETAKEAAGTV